MIERMLQAVVAVLMVFMLNGAVAGAETALIYQDLVGKWEWRYQLGYSTLTVESIDVVDGKIVLKGYYEAYTPSWGVDTRGKGRKITGTIDPQGASQEVTFLFRKGRRRFDLWWNGRGRMWGSAALKHWSGDVDFSKK